MHNQFTLWCYPFIVQSLIKYTIPTALYNPHSTALSHSNVQSSLQQRALPSVCSPPASFKSLVQCTIIIPPPVYSTYCSILSPLQSIVLTSVYSPPFRAQSSLQYKVFIHTPVCSYRPVYMYHFSVKLTPHYTEVTPVYSLQSHPFYSPQCCSSKKASLQGTVLSLTPLYRGHLRVHQLLLLKCVGISPVYSPLSHSSIWHHFSILSSVLLQSKGITPVYSCQSHSKSSPQSIAQSLVLLQYIGITPVYKPQSHFSVQLIL